MQSIKIISKRQKVGLNDFNVDVFIEYSNDMQHVHENIERYNLRKKTNC